jgi:alkylation response protein AidB-like acyl-CoA dehydrogenase
LDDALTRYEAGREFAVETAIAKLAASERLPAVTAAAHQLHGGEGYYEDRPLHRWHRRVLGLAFQLGDARVHRARLANLLATGAGVL